MELHHQTPPTTAIIAALILRRVLSLRAEAQAEQLFDAIEASGMIAPGRNERAVEEEIYALAEREFGVTKHWHKRIVRSGINTLNIASDNPPSRVIGKDDTVFIDLGPVFDEWEADVGRTYVMGNDPQKHRLCADLPQVFDALKLHYEAKEDITGAELYAVAHHLAEGAGWLFGGAIAGHLVGEFPHARIPGERSIQGQPGQSIAHARPRWSRPDKILDTRGASRK